tara:strand:+ start:218 stop:547 length:330 start_codon:yes stop_codon:yes gene_type:complete
MIGPDHVERALEVATDTAARAGQIRTLGELERAQLLLRPTVDQLDAARRLASVDMLRHGLDGFELDGRTWRRLVTTYHEEAILRRRLDELLEFRAALAETVRLDEVLHG